MNHIQLSFSSDRSISTAISQDKQHLKILQKHCFPSADRINSIQLKNYCIFFFLNNSKALCKNNHILAIYILSLNKDHHTKTLARAVYKAERESKLLNLFSPRPRNNRLTASREPPKHNAVGNVFLQSYKKASTWLTHYKTTQDYQKNKKKKRERDQNKE